MILADIIATLAHEPFGLSLDEIKRLTLFQVRMIYFREKDDRGMIKKLPHPDNEFRSESARLVEASFTRRCPVWFLEQKYNKPQGKPSSTAAAVKARSEAIPWK